MKFQIACLTFLVTLVFVSSDSQSAVQSNPRITNGQHADQGAHPYQISLQWKSWILGTAEHICGGSIIGSLWVITAAHCFTTLPNGIVTVVAGKRNIYANEAIQQSRRVSFFIIHPSYAGGVNPHDLALIKVASAFTFNDVVAPIALPAKNIVHSGDVVISGWGSTSLTTTPNQPIFLQTATVPIIDTSECYHLLTNVAPDPPLDPNGLDHVCTGSPDEANISVCTKDSGGPAAQLIDGNWELVGVISWAIFPCGQVGAPSVHVRVSAYTDWINEQIASNN